MPKGVAVVDITRAMDSFAPLTRTADIHGLHFARHVHITYARVCPLKRIALTSRLQLACRICPPPSPALSRSRAP
eukprot:217809-Rhodomonas_salina.1